MGGSAGAHPRARREPRSPADASMTKMTVAKMTVAQLRKELESRGLDTSGLKAALVSRLEASLADDGAGAEPEGGDAPGARVETLARRRRLFRPPRATASDPARPRARRSPPRAPPPRHATRARRG